MSLADMENFFLYISPNSHGLSSVTPVFQKRLLGRSRYGVVIVSLNNSILPSLSWSVNLDLRRQLFFGKVRCLQSE